jgi:RNA polymerase sigma-70 factor (ECF subfamily)
MPAISESSTRLSVLDPDVALMLEVRDGSPDAFAQLMELHQARLLGVLVNWSGNRQEAEDLAQEVFLRVYQTRQRYRAKARFNTWLYTIASNLLRNHRRNSRLRRAASLPASESGPFGAVRAFAQGAPMDLAPPDTVQREEIAETVRRAVAGLQERQRLAVLLNKFEDMSYLQIAEVMGMTEKGVKSLLARARTNLRDTLGPLLDRSGQTKGHES